MSEPPQPTPPEPSAATPPPVWLAVSPALRAALFDPESWHESLEAYAHDHEPGGRPRRCGGTPAGAVSQSPADVESVARPPAGGCSAPRHADTNGARPRCPFVLAPDTPCTCVEDALARRELVLRRDRTGLVHFTVPLVLDDHPVGALLAGQVFDQYPEQLVLEHVATRLGLSPAALWQVARLEVPVKRATLRVYGRLLAALGQAFLHTRYHTLLDAQRLAALEQRFQERTAALHHEIAERQRLEREAQRVQHFALLGQLAAGVSHEIRNPLGAVFLHVDLLAEELQQPAPNTPAVVAETLAEIKTNLARLEELVQDYLSLVRVGTLQLTTEDLGAAVQAWTPEFHALAAPQWRVAPARRPQQPGVGGGPYGHLASRRAESRAECAGGHAAGGDAHAHGPEHADARAAPDPGYRQRHPRRAAHHNFRALIHDQARRDRIGVVHRARNCAGARGTGDR